MSAAKPQCFTDIKVWCLLLFLTIIVHLGLSSLPSSLRVDMLCFACTCVMSEGKRGRLSSEQPFRLQLVKWHTSNLMTEADTKRMRKHNL